MLLASLPRLLLRRATALAAVLAATTLFAQTPSALDGFDPNVNGNVLVLATQADGKLIMGGQFSSVAGVARNNLARLNADGTLDASFNPNPNGAVRALALYGDGRMIIGGDFTSVQPGATGATTARGRIARLNADGSVEPTLNLGLGGALQPQVHAVLLQADGRIVAGGSFTSVGAAGATATTTRNYLARFNADGSLDASFNPNPNSLVLALANHVENKIIVGGGFTTLQPAGDAVAATRNRIARLNANGTLDSEFNPNANNGITTLAVQRDGKIVLGGFFTTLQPPGEESAVNRSRLARLNVNGSIDSEFISRAEGNVAAVALQSDGAILVGGSFTGVWGRGANTLARSFVARFHPDGAVDPDFAPVVNAAVDAFAFQPDGKIVLGGHFTRAQAAGSSTAVVRNHLARVTVDGSLDTNFELDAGGRPLISVTQGDGRVVVAGSFTSIGGMTRTYVARLNADGTVDASYNPVLDGRVYALALQPDGKVVLGGAFTTIGGEPRNHIARLNPSGTIDSEFNPNINGQVGVIVLQPDGRILVGGTFTTVQPIGAAATTNRSNALRLNANGTLDPTFDPSPNAGVAAIALQSDNKVLLGGTFSALTPGLGTTVSSPATGRAALARVNGDGTLDAAFNPNPNGPVTSLAVQGDGKIVIGGAFTGLNPNGASPELTPRHRIARLNTDGTVDAAYDPNANGNVLALALQPDGRLLVGGAFTTLQPNGAADWTLRKYAARLNADGTVDPTFNLDLDEQAGNRIDSLRVQADGRILLGGNFASLHPVGAASRISRRNFARLLSTGAIDLGFDAAAGGAPSGTIHALAVQPDGKVIAVGSFSDLGSAKSSNIARFRPEGTPDPEFSPTLGTDGAVHAVAIRPNGAPVATQLGGFAWLNANGTLRPGFAANTRLSGAVSAIAVQTDGRLLLGGAFTNLSNTTGGNLVRFNANGSLDSSYNPAPNGVVTGIAIQPDGRAVIVGAFTVVNGVARQRIARINTDGTVDVTFDPSANARVNAVVLQSDGLILIGGNFTSLTPNLATTAVTRNYLARLNADGTVDSNYNPSPNFNVNALALQGDGKLIAGGNFTAVTPNGATTTTTRSGVARFNTDGTVDQNFDPNANAPVNAILALPNGQILIGGGFTTLQPNAGGTTHARSNLARINSDGAVDVAFNPNPNGAVTSLALQPDGAVLVAGAFTTLQPGAAGATVTRQHLARLTANGALDLNFNPDVNGTVGTVAARPDGTVLLGGNFTALQLNGSIIVGGNFASIGGVPARNLASLNDNGSVNATFQPRPDGAVNALLVQADGKMVVGGDFTNISGVARNRIARFNADGTLDTAFNPATGIVVSALALQADGKILVGGRLAVAPAGPERGRLVRLNPDGTSDAGFTWTTGAAQDVHEIATQPDGRILVVAAEGGAPTRDVLRRANANGGQDASFQPVDSPAAINVIALQADGNLVAGGALSAGSPAISRLVRFTATGGVDSTYNPAPNGPITALAIQSDGRVLVAGGFSSLGGVTRVGIGRVGASGPAVQQLTVTANRSAVRWHRSGTVGEISSASFEMSTDRIAWTRLGEGTRIAGTSDWQLTGLSLPAAGVFYIRARGIVPSSGGTSSGLYESIREFSFSGLFPEGIVPANSTPAVAGTAAIQLAAGHPSRSVVATVAGEGTVEIFVAQETSASDEVQPSRIANLSTRGRVVAGSPLLLGFAVAGSESRAVLLRAIGPGLRRFGLEGALAAARLEVYDGAGRLIATNDGWDGDAGLAAVAARTGAFPLTAGSADSAALLSLAPGNYTLQVLDTAGGGGVALAEIYDAGSGAGARLVNVSTRGAAGTGADALISGFVITGGLPQRVLLRAIGPGLAQFGAFPVVTDPSLGLFDASGAMLGSNDDWVSSVGHIAGAAVAAGAFPLTPGSRDAAVLATLPAGAYTIQVAGTATGTALLEIYELR